MTKRRFSFSPVVRPVTDVLRVRARFVGMMKLTLPLIAAGLMIALFVWPGSFDSPAGLQLSFVSATGEEANRLTMVSPRYVGTDNNNQPFVITAGMAEQNPTDNREVSLTTVQADMAFEDKSWFTMLADKGVYNQVGQTLRLAGKINIFSNIGYELHTDALHINLATGIAATESNVRGHGPFGRIIADRLESENRGKLLRFVGNVKLVVSKTMDEESD